MKYRCYVNNSYTILSREYWQKVSTGSELMQLFYSYESLGHGCLDPQM